MWFKNLTVFRIDDPLSINLEQLEAQLKRGEFSPCPASRAKSIGWIPPRDDGALVYACDRQWLIALGIEERLLPTAVINDELRRRVAEIEKHQGHTPGRKQLKELRERITEELMPRAFTRMRKTYVWIDPLVGWFGINTSSPAKADEVIEHLRKCLDIFPLRRINTKFSASSAMAEWLASGEPPAGFTIDRDCELKALGEEKATVAYKHHQLDGEQLREHLAAGKLPTKLALTWDDRISFVLSEKMVIKRLQFLDLMRESADQSAENAADQFDADFALMAGEFCLFIPCLIDALGGIDEEHIQ